MHPELEELNESGKEVGLQMALDLLDCLLQWMHSPFEIQLLPKNEDKIEIYYICIR